MVQQITDHIANKANTSGLQLPFSSTANDLKQQLEDLDQDLDELWDMLKESRAMVSLAIFVLWETCTVF